VLFLLLSCSVPLIRAEEAKEQPCIKPEQAVEFMGKNVCVAGKVLNVGMSRAGTIFLNFCEDRYKCPFTAVAFARNADKVGDLRVLKGKAVEIRGRVKDYKGQPEIVINSREQIKTDAFIPKLPAEFGADRDDATNLGQFSGRSKRDRAW
jgi:DNA/RNA endonuclease YhcR with UshA esterase domain